MDKAALLKVTNSCNLKCMFCSQESHYNLNEDDLPLDQIYLIIDRLSLLGVQRLRLTGGEPLTREDIIDIVKLARMKFKKFSIFSNLSLVNYDILKEIIRLGPEIIWTTILDHSPNVHDFLVKILGSHRLTVASIQFLTARGIHVGVQIPITKYNYPNLSDTISFVQQLRVKTIKIIPMFPIGRAERNKNKLIIPILWNQIFKIVTSLDFTDSHYSEIKISQMQTKKSKSQTQIPKCISNVKNILNIDHKGRVFSCCALMGDERFALFDLLADNFREQYERYSIEGERNIISQFSYNFNKISRGNYYCPVFFNKFTKNKIDGFYCPLEYYIVKKND